MVDFNIQRKPRSSNLELYRIICMIMIVAHHYVVSSGLREPMHANPNNINSIFLYFFGMWGKTGINCFLLITGYFMCKSNITIRKFLKLILEIYFYNIVIYCVFLCFGYEVLSPIRLFKLFMLTFEFRSNFVGCFVAFWLTIPFWNILIRNMTQIQHKYLLLLLLLLYTVLGSVPGFDISFNYITWFGIVYLIAAYIRLYPISLYEKKKLWLFLTIAFMILAFCVTVLLNRIGWGGTSFVEDSNKIFAVIVAVCSFLYFKNINIRYHKFINLIGASTFGVLLIHANSDAMRQWLWKDTIAGTYYYSLSSSQFISYSLMAVLAIFISCIIIDRIRICFFEEPFLKWYDKKNNH